MKSLLIKGPGKLELTDVPEPSPGAGEVKLQVKNCAICGSDTQEYLDGDANGIFGHEFSGVITELGEGVTSANVGDRVAAHAYDSRGFSEFAVIPADKAVPLHDEITFSQGSLLETMAVLLTPFRHSNFRIGDTCLISGCGSIGLMGILILKAFGARRIVASNRGDYRRNKALEFGADFVFNPKETTIEEVIERAGEKFDFALECVGNGPSFMTCKKALRPNGILCGLGISAWPIEVSTLQMFTSEEEFQPSIQIRGMTPFDTSTFEVAQRLILDGKVDAEAIVTHHRPFVEAVEAFEMATDSAQNTIKIVLDMD